MTYQQYVGRLAADQPVFVGGVWDYLALLPCQASVTLYPYHFHLNQHLHEILYLYYCTPCHPVNLYRAPL